MTAIVYESPDGVKWQKTAIHHNASNALIRELQALVEFYNGLFKVEYS